MKIKQFENQEAFENYLNSHEIKTGELVYIHENGKHNIDGEIKARSTKEAATKLIQAVEQIGIIMNYDIDFMIEHLIDVNEPKNNDGQTLRFDIECMDKNTYYIHYIVSDLWA